MSAAKRKAPPSSLPTGPKRTSNESAPAGKTSASANVASADRGVQLQTAALQLAQLGWSVFPCKGKEPAGALVPHGFRDATRDPEQIAAWWPRGSRLNIGAVPPEGCYVVDIDVYKDEAALEPLAIRMAGIHTPMQRSGGGGVHFVLRGHPPSPAALRRALRIEKGIDVRAHGSGYVIAAPSVHPETGGFYEWATQPNVRIADAPSWLTDKTPAEPETDAPDDSWSHRANEPIEKVVMALRRLDPDCDNDTWVRYGQALKLEYGEDGWQVWHEWSATAKQKYDSEAECRKRWESFGNNEHAGTRPVTVRSILADAYGARREPDPPPSAGLRLYNPLDRPPQSIAYMLREPLWLPDISEQVILFGQSETFKSVVTQGICAYLAAGVSLDGEAIAPRVVVYAAEEAPTLFDNNLHAWRMHFDKTLAPEVAEHARTNLEAGYLQRIDGHIEGLDDKRAEELVWLVHEQQRKLDSKARPVVVLDPVAEVMPGEESKTEDMRRYIGAGRVVQRKTGALIVHVHHTGHGDTGRERGSSTLPAAMYARYEVKRPVPTAYELEIRCKKHKGRAKPAPSRWQVSQIGLVPEASDLNRDPLTGVVVQYRGEALPEVTLADVRAVEESQTLGVLLRAYRDEPTIGRPRLALLLGCGNGKVDRLRSLAIARDLLAKGKGDGRAGYLLTDAGHAMADETAD